MFGLSAGTVATIASGAASLGGAIIGANASGSAADASAQAANASTAEQKRQYDLTRSDYAPYREVGVNALNKLGKLYGVQQQPTVQQTAYAPFSGYSGSGGYGDYGAYAFMPQPQVSTPVASSQQSTAPDYSDFYSSPDYDFTRKEGMRGIQQTAAARGGAFSGNALRGLSDYTSGLASQQFGNYANRLASLAGIGQSATGSTASAGQSAANGISNGLMAAGDARASGIMGAANSWTGSINSGLNNYLMLNRGGFGGGGGSGGLSSLYSSPNTTMTGDGTYLSDRRLKTNIEHIATRLDGLKVYVFEYVFEAGKHVGLMAQEVLDLYPDAVVERPDGYLMVDYSKV